MSITVKQTINANDPVKCAYDNEFTQLFLSFCSFVCVIKNKKMNLPNIFLWLLKEQELREVFKLICEVETDYDVLKCFLVYDPTLYRSKYIRNYLQANPDLHIKL